MNFDNIPAELRVLKQWSCFRTYTDNEGKRKKVIISPVDSKFAKCNVSETWTDYESAKRYCLRNRYAGLTFALTGGITCIDIDHAIDKDGNIQSEEAKQLILLLADTYIEKSVSGTGIHIFMKGSLPPNARNRNDKKGLEMYDKDRFICMTGDLFSSGSTLKDCTETVAEINRSFIGVRPDPVEFTRPDPVWNPSDNELTERIRASKIGTRFNELYSGVLNGYSDHSSADFALCSLLAWWTQDAAQIDRIFRGSGLYRPKWDTLRGTMTYGSLTIQRALQSQSGRYEPQSRLKVVYKTPAEM